MPATPRSAVVVGLCAHGLDVARALSMNGIRVHALESKRELPGFDTRLATVHLVDAISGGRLVPAIASGVEVSAREILPSQRIDSP